MTTQLISDLYTINKGAKWLQDGGLDSLWLSDEYQANIRAKLDIPEVFRDQSLTYQIKQTAIDYLIDNNLFDKIEEHEVNDREFHCLYVGDYSFHFYPNIMGKYYNDQWMFDNSPQWTYPVQKVATSYTGCSDRTPVTEESFLSAIDRIVDLLS